MKLREIMVEKGALCVEFEKFVRKMSDLGRI